MIKQTLVKKLTKNLAGGIGDAFIMDMLEGDELPNNARLIAEATLTPGATVGYHQHVGESELYYIVSGEGDYQDNGETVHVSAGATTMVYDGGYHGLINTGDKPLVFFAVIVKE